MTALLAGWHDTRACRQPIRWVWMPSSAIKTRPGQAVQMGMQINTINAAGGSLGGRKLELVTRDNRSIPAIGSTTCVSFCYPTQLVGVFGGKFSPVVRVAAAAHELACRSLPPGALPTPSPII
jgi:hypothetical protein